MTKISFVEESNGIQNINSEAIITTTESKKDIVEVILGRTENTASDINQQIDKISENANQKIDNVADNANKKIDNVANNANETIDEYKEAGKKINIAAILLITVLCMAVIGIIFSIIMAIANYRDKKERKERELKIQEENNKILKNMNEKLDNKNNNTPNINIESEKTTEMGK